MILGIVLCIVECINRKTDNSSIFRIIFKDIIGNIFLTTDLTRWLLTRDFNLLNITVGKKTKKLQFFYTTKYLILMYYYVSDFMTIE